MLRVRGWEGEMCCGQGLGEECGASAGEKANEREGRARRERILFVDVLVQWCAGVTEREARERKRE